MTRDEHLEFCKKCLNRKFDPNHGVVCGLTGAIANFERECPDFKLDAAAAAQMTSITHFELDPEEVKRKVSSDTYERLRMEQNLVNGVIAGLGAAIAGSIIWAVITVATGFQVGYMAILIGALVGFAMRKAGKGLDLIFGILGGAIALFGCVLGNFLSVLAFVAVANELGYMETLLGFDYGYTLELMSETFDFRHLIFYAIAAVAGFRLALRKITEGEVRNLNKG